MTFCTPILAIALAAASLTAIAAEVKLPQGRETPCQYGQYYAGREKPLPLLDHPLRDPSICRGPDGVYYMTGTDGTPALPAEGKLDFENNDGIRVWKSTDLENWEPLGKVFDIVKWTDNQIPWWRYPTVKANQPFGPLVRGVTAPEIHYINDTFYIVFSISGQGVGILRSRTQKAEGPYQLLHAPDKHNYIRPIVFEGGSPSLFQDTDKKVYLLWGQGLIAPLNDDMTALAAPPQQLLLQPNPQQPDTPRTVGQAGFHLFKADGTYCLTAQNISYRDQHAASDVFVATSDSLLGPYTQRRWMIPHAGETTVFRGPADRLLATYCGKDEESAFTDRPGIIPLQWDTEKKEGDRTTEWKFPRIAAGVHTERGCWDKLLPITEYAMRDVQCIRAPDGWYYYTGSCNDPHFAGRLVVLRSKDLVNWEEQTIMTLDNLPWLSAASLAARKEASAKVKGRTLDDKFMDCEVHYLKGTFYFVYSLYEMKKAQLGEPEPGKAHHGVYFMRSTSGKIDGPWEHLGRFRASQASFFEDSDGTVYVPYARYNLSNMKPDMTGREEQTIRALPADGSHAFTDVGVSLQKINGKYVYFSCGYANGWWHEPAPVLGDDGITSYNYSYMVADKPLGPYSRARMAVDYGGHGGVFQDDQGRWWAAFFGNEGARDFRRHWWGQPGIVPLEVFEKDGQLTIRVARDLPADYAAALEKKRAQKANPQ